MPMRCGRDMNLVDERAPEVEMVCELDSDGVFSRVNSDFARILGHPCEAVHGQRLTNFVHAEDHAVTLAALARLAAGSQAVRMENRCYTQAGAYVWIVWLMTRSANADLIYAAACEVTPRRGIGDGRAEREGRIRRAPGLRRENALLRTQAAELAAHRNALQRVLELNHALLDASIDGIRLVDVDGRTILANAVIDHLTTEVFGLPRDATLSQRSAIAARLTDPAGYLATMDTIESDSESETEDVFEIVDLKRAFQRHTRPVRDSSGVLIGRIIIVREITEARAATLEAASLKAAERLKSELVATVSHELRTPLTAVLGFAELLMRDDLDEDARRLYVETIHGEAQRLTALVDDFLDLRKIEAGQFQLTLERLDLGDLIRAEAELFAKQSASHTINVAAPGVLEIVGDRSRLRQLIGNLLSNAIKYSPAGGIVELGAVSGPANVRISVRDHGIGIPPDQQGNLFAQFFRVDSADTREIGGTGLGLSLCKEIAEAHGGRILLESSSDEGSTFCVELPHATAAAIAA
jgi:PAS domain S-box-containing protein